MKHAIKMFVVIVLGLAFAGTAAAQFNRVGDKGSVTASYVQVNAPNTSSWQGAELDASIPVAYKADVAGQTVRFNVDLLSGYQRTHGGGNGDANVAYYGVGGTTWLNFDFAKEGFSLAPYFRVGLQGNSGNFVATNQSYFAYSVEPGVVAKYGSVYALVAYAYGEGFNSEFGSVVNQPRVGLGIDITKDFAVEAHYDMNRGSYNYDRVVAGVVYRF